MNNIIKLFKLSLKMIFREDTKKNNNKFKKSIVYILIFISVLPLMASFTLISKQIYEALQVINQGYIVIALSLSAGSLVVLTFGIFYTISSYYMAKDIPNYLSLPLKPHELIISRFLITLLYEYFTLFIFVLPVIIGCGIGGNMGFTYYLMGAIVFIVLPMLPLSIASVIIIILMSFSKKALNKDRFTLVSGLIGLAIGLGMNFSMQTMFRKIEDPKIIKQLMESGQFDLLEKATSYFPGVKNATYAIIFGDIFQLLIFVLIAVFAFVILIAIANKLYFKGVLGINQQPAKRDFDIKNVNFKKSNNPVISYMIKEIKILFRTPIFFMNLVLMDYLMPVMIVFGMTSSGNISDIISKINNIIAKGEVYGILLSIVFGIFVFISSMNGVTATCISREGKQIYIMKYLPISIENQIKAKLLSGVLISTTGMIFVLVVIEIFFKFNIAIFLLMLIVAFNGLFLTRVTGLLIDLKRPKINWDNEIKAVKQNMNLLFNILLGMIITGISVFLSIKLNINMIFAILIFVFGIAFINYIIYKLLKNKAYSLIMEVE